MGKPEEVMEYIKTLEQSREDIEAQVMDVVYWMPGISWYAAWELSFRLRKKLVDYISKNERMKRGDKTEYM